MDELSQITEYIQGQAGDEAEVIFGHGVDPTIGDRIRVTVIATGFTYEGPLATKIGEKKVHDLDRTQFPLFGSTDNSVNQQGQEIELKIREGDGPKMDKDKPVLTKPGDKPVLKPEDKPVSAKPVAKRKEEEPPKKEEKSHTFTLFEKEESKPPQENDPLGDDGEDSLFLSDEDDFGIGREISADQIVNEEGLMELRKTKERLEQQAKSRREKLKAYKKPEMTKEEFNEKWTLPAYLRRGVKMDNVPHSSEPFISRYNLNDDNNLLGNNKFLHDNVD
jgi:cell division protein FtsZ